MAKCFLCRDRQSESKYDGLCDLCFYTRFQVDEIVEAYSKEQVEDQIRNFIPEIELTFERDNTYKHYFNTALEIIVLNSLYNIPSPISMERIPSLGNLDMSKTNKIFDVLNLAKIASIEKGAIYLGSISDELVKRLPAGVDLNSPEIQTPLKEVRGAICVALGKSLIEAKKPVTKADEICEKCGRPMVVKSGTYGKFLGCTGYPKCDNTKSITIRRPRNFLLNFNCLTSILSHYEPFGSSTKSILKEIDSYEFFIPLGSGLHRDRYMIQIPEKQMLKILGDIIGWTKAEPKIIESFHVTSKGYSRFTLKGVTVEYLERMRERRRERIIGR